MIHRGLYILLGVGCLASSASGLVVSSAVAQEGTNSIKVIKKDGGIQSLEIPNASQQAPQNVMSGQDLLQQMENAIAEEPSSATVLEVEQTVPDVPEEILQERADKPIPAEAIPLEEPNVDDSVQAQKEVESIKEAVIKKVEPKKTVAKKKRKITNSRRAKAKPKVQTYAKTNMPPPLPTLKPVKPAYAPMTPRVVDYTNLPSGVVIDSDTALRIALEYAPPARSFTVYEGRKYKDRVVYQVTFRTEGGPHDILIDSENGDVLKK